jgi:hypothetical protein
MVLATCLALLLIVTLLAAAGIREATLELAKTGSQQGAMRAFAAAQSGLALTLAAGGFGHTAPRDLPWRVQADGTTWRSEVRFLGVGALPTAVQALTPDSTDVAWHFSVEAVGRGPRGARSRQRQQVYVRGGPPADPARCLDPGCAVPLPCPGPPGSCDAAPEPAWQPVAWHILEEDG